MCVCVFVYVCVCVCVFVHVFSYVSIGLSVYLSAITIKKCLVSSDCITRHF